MKKTASSSKTQFQVEEILAKRKKRNQEEYLVKWFGYPEKDATWQPLSHLEKCKKLVNQFNQGLMELNKSTRSKRSLSSSIAQNKTDKLSEVQFKILDMRKKSGIQFLVQQGNNQRWVGRKYALKKYPQELCLFYEKCYVFKEQ